MRSSFISQLLALVSSLAFFVLLTNASATTYYVRTDGNDANTGTGSSAAQAWATVTAAATKSLSPSDVVYIQAGTYSGTIEPTVDGTLGNPIIFIADRAGSVSGWSPGDVIIQAPVGQHALHVSFDDYLTFSDILFEGDSGSDTVDVDNGTGTVLQRCEIYGGYIGFDIDDADATIVNCLVRDNINDGINLNVGNLVVRNSTVANNADDGVYIFSGTLTVTNCIIANNSRYGLAVSSGTMTHTYNLVYGSGNSDFSGTTQHATEIVADPQFASATDFHISMLSPARNAGTDLTGTVDDDLDGRARPAYGAYDIGCYEEGPTGHYKLDETAGVVAADSSGLGNDGTYINGPTLGSSGAYGYAAEINMSDTDDRVDLPHTALNGAIDASVSFWIKTTHTGAAAVLSGASVAHHNSFLTFFNSSSSVVFYYRNIASTFSIASIADDQWHHFVFTWDGDTNLVTLYRNGELVGSGTIAGTTGLPLVIAPGGLLLGQDQDTVGGSFDPSQTFRGSLDEVRIYNRTLSAEEITGLYGLVGHWKLDETSGTVAADSSGLGRDGTLSGDPTWSTTGIRGGSIDLETAGTDDHIDLGNFDVVGTGLTLTAWIRQENPLHDGRILMKSNGNTGNDQRWGLTIDDSGELDFRVTAGGSFRTLKAPAVINSGSWYYVTGTYDGTTMRLYLNGDLIASSVHAPGGAIVGDSGQTVTLGDSPIGGRPFDGLIDDARIYNRALTDAEINELYGLVGHWKLDETSGSVAADNSGLGNDGTYEGSPTLGVEAAYGTGIKADYTDGDDDYVDIPNSPSLEDTQEGSFTVSAWFKPESIPQGTGSANDSAQGILIKEGWHTGIYYATSGRFIISHFLTGSVWQGAQTPWGKPYAPGRYYHVVGVVDREAGETKIYVDGNLITTTNFTPGTAAFEMGTVPWRIGIGKPGNATFKWAADAAIDDARIYNRALSAIEIKELYGLMGHWKLDETSGTTAADSSGLGNDGTYSNGPTLGSCGPYVNAVDFDGIDDHVDLPDMNIDYSEGFSAAVWIRPSADPNTFYAFFGTANGVTDDEIWFGYVGSFLELFVSDTTDGSASYVLLDNSPAVLDTWQHCVVTVDASGNGKLYRDGIETASGFVSLPANITRTDNFIGKSVFNDEFPGELDDVRVYNRPLTAKQVAELHGLVGHWKLDETSGTVAADATAFGNDGTYTNGPVLDMTGKVDRSVLFDGADDYVGIADNSILQMDNVFSLSAWVRVDSSTNVDRMIINKEGEYEVALSSTNEIKWGITNTDPGWSWHYTGHSIANNAWGHIVVTYDNGTVKTYADGVLVDTYLGSGSVGDQYTLLNELRIGGRSNNPTGKYFDGRIDDVRVYSRVLCDEEVEALHNGGANLGVRIIKWVETL